MITDFYKTFLIPNSRNPFLSNTNRSPRMTGAAAVFSMTADRKWLRQRSARPIG